MVKRIIVSIVIRGINSCEKAKKKGDVSYDFYSRMSLVFLLIVSAHDDILNVSAPGQIVADEALLSFKVLVSSG